MSLFDKNTISSISNIYLFYSFWLLYTLQNACLDSFLETFLRLFWNLTSRGALIVKSEKKEHLRNFKPDNWGNIYKNRKKGYVMVQLENWNISILTLFCNCEHKNLFSNWTNQEVSFKSVVQQSPEIQKKLSKNIKQKLAT